VSLRASLGRYGTTIAPGGGKPVEIWWERARRKRLGWLVE
jgi:hypothetical protein